MIQHLPPVDARDDEKGGVDLAPDEADLEDE